jgi:hypothetical protein
MAVQPIPQPQLLDPHRVIDERRDEFTADDHKQRADKLEYALQESCEYAQQLWEALDSVRAYLFDALPPDPRTSDGHHASGGAHPTGPDDEDGWQRWGAAYSATTSVLCGPHGDSGFGVSEATEAMQRRRQAAAPPAVDEGAPTQDAPEPAGSSVAASTSAASTSAASMPVAERRPVTAAKAAGFAALGVLALRGLFAGRAGR